MEKPKKSKALIITIVLLVIIAIVLFFIFRNKNTTKSVSDANPNVFQSLFGTSKSKNLDVIGSGTGTDGDQSKEVNVLLLQEKGKVTASENILPGDFLVKSGDVNSSIVKVAIPNNVSSANLYGIAINAIDANDTGDILLAGEKIYVTARENVKVGDFVIYIGNNSTLNLPIVEIANPNNSRALSIYGIAIKDIGIGNILITDINSNSSLWSKIKNGVNSTVKYINDVVYRVFNGKSKTTDTTGTGTDTFCVLNPSSPSCKGADNCPFPKITNVNTNACIDQSDCLPPMVINGNQCQNPNDLLCTDTTATNFEEKGECIYGNVCPPGWTGTYPNCVDPNPGQCILPKIINEKTNACIDPSECIPNPPMQIIGNKCKDTSKSPTITVTANPTKVKTGGTSKITWTSTNTQAKSCSLVGGSEGFTGGATSGSSSTRPLGIDTDITVTCLGTNGSSISKTVTVAIDGGGGACLLPKITNEAGKCIDPSECIPNPPMQIIGNKCKDTSKSPTITVTANPTKVKTGGTSKITWTSTNTQAKSCSLVGGGEGFTGGATSGSSSTRPLGIDTDITVTCLGTNGSSVSKTVTVTVDGGGGGGDTLPDLTAGATSPTTATVNTTFSISSVIKNIGESPTGSGFLTSFTIQNSKGEEKSVVSILTPEIPAGGEEIITSPLKYNFSQVGTYKVQACADQRVVYPNGMIDESNETNNCGPWTILNVEGAIPPPGDTGTPTVSVSASPKNIKSGGTSKITWTSTNTQAKSCTLVGGGEGFTGGETSGSSSTRPLNIDTDVTVTCEGTNGSSASGMVTVKIDNVGEEEPLNICLNIEQNPLTFTPEEKARLAVLLRKFYLISSTLKTTEDISTIYNEIDQQKNFIAQIKDLTTQCYAQIPEPLHNGWVRHGNPWYTKTSGGEFPYTSDSTGYSNAYMSDGTGYLYGGTTELNNTERILNIW